MLGPPPRAAVPRAASLLAPRPGWTLSSTILLWVAVPFLGAALLLAGLLALTRLQARVEAAGLAKALGDIVTVTAREHVRDAMVLGGGARTALWVRALSGIEDVESVQLVSPEYRVAISADPATVGRTVEDAAMRAAMSGAGIQSVRSGGLERLVVPLENERDCHDCHGATKRTLGAVDLRIRRGGSIPEPMGSFLLFGVLLIIGTLGAAAAVVVWTTDRYLVEPIGRLSAASRELAKGEAGTVNLGDAPAELVALGADVAAMARRIREQGTAVARARRDNEQVRVLAGLGEMAARVAHEVRNPLNSIEGAAFYLGNRLAADEEAQEYLGLIRNEVARISAVAADLLSAAKPVEPSLERVCLDDLVRERCRLMNLAQAEPVRVEVDVSPDPPQIFADRRQLAQVIDNLLENAVQAVAGAGGIRARVAVIELSSLQRSLRLTIEDDGPGLSDEAREKLFTPFFTTKPGGTGLGLIIVRKIVEAHRGTFTLKDAPGGGAHAIVEFPV
ncbi:MAG: sensor histidine kinase [Thermoanaerobaculia bacterium]